MLWVSSKPFGVGFNHVFAVFACTAVSACFLDESPRTGTAKTSSSATGQTDGGPKRGFVPREPGMVRTESIDAGGAPTAGSGGPTKPVPVTDAAAPSVTPRADAQVAPAIDAQVPPLRDAQVVPVADAGTLPAAPDAQVTPAQDAALPASDAQVALDATTPPLAALPQPIHRYEFEGAGRVAIDSIGAAHGELQGRAVLGGMGEVQLGGTYQDGVQLPPRIMNGLTSFALLGWTVPRTQECTQRLFEFIYYRDGGNGQRGAQVSAFYLAPYACPDDRPALGYLTERNFVNLVSSQALPDAREQVLLGAMYDADSEELQLIVNGVVEQSMTVKLQQRELSSAQGSLGRSSPEGNTALGSSIAEFRIYDRTLDAATLAEIARRGPDQL